jgi:prepilin-type processing-associated H-X9-DG protein
MTASEIQPTIVSTPHERPWQFSLLKMLLWFVALSVLMAFLRVGWIAVEKAREAGRCSSCKGHCAQLAVALHNYHDVYGSFPPAYVADAAGNPMHSWRVLLLPFIEEHSLYQRYNFNEPWNGPNNRLLAAEMPRTYGCPSAHGHQPGDETNYVVVVGAGTAWPGARSVSLDQIKDKKDETLLFVEVQGSGISWMEPRDLEINAMPLRVNPRGKLGISSWHPGSANVSMVDGTIGVLNGATTAEELRSRLTIAAGD